MRSPRGQQRVARRGPPSPRSLEPSVSVCHYQARPEHGSAAADTDKNRAIPGGDETCHDRSGRWTNGGPAADQR